MILVACLSMFYGLSSATIAMLSLRGRIEPRRAMTWMQRWSAIWLPIIMITIVVQAWLIDWIVGLVFTPLAVMCVPLAWLVWRFEGLMRRWE